MYTAAQQITTNNNIHRDTKDLVGQLQFVGGTHNILSSVSGLTMLVEVKLLNMAGYSY